MVSEILGEMLKLSMVVTLVATLSFSVYGLLPEDRIPYAEIEIRDISTANGASSINLIHIGGDTLQQSKVDIIVKNESGYRYEYSLNESWNFNETVHLTTNITNISEVLIVHERAVLANYEVQK